MAVFNYVQSAQATGTTVLGFGTANTAGNLIVVVDGGYNLGLPSSISDSQGNTYTNIIYSDADSNRISVWAATSIASGTNTLTMTGASTTNQCFIIAEYQVPSAYLLGSVATPIQSNRTTSVISVPILALSTAVLPSEVMIIPIFSDQASFHSWTLSGGTVRQNVSEPGGATVFLGDYDVVNPSSVVVTTASGSNGTWLSGSIYLMTIGTGTGGGSGGVILGDMAGGMRN